MSDWENDDWENESIELNIDIAQNKKNELPVFSDEDCSDDETKNNSTIKQPTKKPNMKQIIKAREEAERKAAEKRARIIKEAEEAEMTPAELKAKRQRDVEKADLDNTKDLFGDFVIDDKASAKENVTKTSELFLKLQTTNKKEYTSLVKDLVRGVCVDMRSDDIKAVISAMNVLANKRLAEEKAASTKGKKKKKDKPSLKSTHGGELDDMSVGCEYDDFM